jgi:hypothetical protein
LLDAAHKLVCFCLVSQASCTLNPVLQSETASDSSQRRLAMAEVPGFKDQIMQDIFTSQGLLPLGPEYFSEPKSDAIISVVTRTSFALFLPLTLCRRIR